MGDPLRRRVRPAASSAAASAWARRRAVLGEPGRQLFAYQRVAEAVAATRALEHAGRLGLAERFFDTIGARERDQRRLREAVFDYRESGEQRLAEPVEPLEPLPDDLAQPGRHRHLARGVHRRGQLFGEERVARRRARDRVERSRRQWPAGRALRHGCERRCGRADQAPVPPPPRAPGASIARAPRPRRAAHRRSRRRRACARRRRCAQDDGQAPPWLRRRCSGHRSPAPHRVPRRPARVARRLARNTRRRSTSSSAPLRGDAPTAAVARARAVRGR